MAFDQVIAKLVELYKALLSKNTSLKSRVAYELSKSGAGISIKELDGSDAKTKGWDDSAIFTA